MYRCFLVLFILLFCSLPFKADSFSIIETEAQLVAIPKGTVERLKPLLSLSTHYIYIDTKKSALYAEELVPIALAAGDDNSLARGLRLLGQAQVYQGLSNQAYINLKHGIEVSNRTGDLHLISVANRVMGVLYELILDYDKALEYYLIALRFAEQNENMEDKGMVYNNIGNVLNNQKSFPEAAEYFSRAIGINLLIGNLDLQMNAKIGLGVSYLEMGKLNAAQNILEEVIDATKEIGGFTYSEALVNLAHVNLKKDNIEEAKKYYEFVLNDENGSRYKPAVAAAFIGLADILEQTNQIEQARQLYHRALKTVSDKTYVESEMILYERLSALEYREKNYEAAADIQAKYIQRRNEIQPLTQQGLVIKLETQLKLERDFNKLQQQDLVNERVTRNESYYILGLIAFAITCFFLFIILRLRKQALLGLEKANKALEKISETDPLTGVGNRRYLESTLKQHQGEDKSLAFLLVDIDRFKAVNDSFGHDIGDHVLIKTSEIIQKLCREDDIFARVGGEEFVILLIDVGEEAVVHFAERIRTRIENMVLEINESVTVSIGVSFGHVKDTSYNELYKKSDIALYAAKKEGRNRVHLHNLDDQPYESQSTGYING